MHLYPHRLFAITTTIQLVYSLLGILLPIDFENSMAYGE